MSGERMVDINTATADELDAVSALKGHGHEIVRYREERGRFDDLRQLNEVPGMVGRADGLSEVLTTGRGQP
jgi:competence protein ComEA